MAIMEGLTSGGVEKAVLVAADGTLQTSGSGGGGGGVVTQPTASQLNATVVGTGTLAVQNTAAIPSGTNVIGQLLIADKAITGATITTGSTGNINLGSVVGYNIAAIQFTTSGGASLVGYFAASIDGGTTVGSINATSWAANNSAAGSTINSTTPITIGTGTLYRMAVPPNAILYFVITTQATGASYVVSGTAGNAASNPPNVFATVNGATPTNSGADVQGNSIVGIQTYSRGSIFNGTSWDRRYSGAGSAAAGAGLGAAAVEESGRTFSNITSATTTTVKSGKGNLHAIIINTPVASGTITMFDNTAGSGTKIATITNPVSLLGMGPISAVYDIAFATGLTIVTTGAQDITVSYR